MKNKIEFIAFDADDTLWENELYFQELEHRFCHLLRKYLPAPSISEELFKTEIKNLHIYGYGLKGMLLCMIETICKVTNGEGDLNLVKEKSSDQARNFCKGQSYYWTVCKKSYQPCTKIIN